MTKSIAASDTSTPALTATASPSAFALAINLYSDYQQIVDFRMPGVAVLGLDERRPLGHGWGPSPVQLLGSALGACLGSALLRAIRDAGAEVTDLRTDVSGRIEKDRLDRAHVVSITVRLSPVVSARSALEAVPSPERLAKLSMVADVLRSDLGLWIAITPEVRSTATRSTREVGRGSRPAADVPAPMPHYVEATLQ
jgi:uncharacterized OsmC-like protein